MNLYSLFVAGSNTKEEYTKYMRYLHAPRKRQFGIKDDNMAPLKLPKPTSKSQHKSADRKTREAGETEMETSECKAEGKSQKASTSEKAKEIGKDSLKGNDENSSEVKKTSKSMPCKESSGQEFKDQKTKEEGKERQKSKTKSAKGIDVKSKEHDSHIKKSYPRPVPTSHVKVEDNKSTSSTEDESRSRKGRRKDKSKDSRQNKEPFADITEKKKMAEDKDDGENKQVQMRDSEGEKDGEKEVEMASVSGSEGAEEQKGKMSEVDRTNKAKAVEKPAESEQEVVVSMDTVEDDIKETDMDGPERCT